MEIHESMMYQDVTALPVLRGKLERALRKLTPLNGIEGKTWLLAKGIKGDATIIGVGDIAASIVFDERTEEFVAEYLVPKVRY